MPFRETLRGIVETVEGGLGATIMGYDGIAIDEYLKSDAGMDLHLMAVEYASVLKEVRRAADVLATGAIEELTVNTAAFRVIARVITDDYFLVLTLTHEGNCGRARYLVRRETQVLRDNLS